MLCPQQGFPCVWELLGSSGRDQLFLFWLFFFFWLSWSWAQLCKSLRWDHAPTCPWLQEGPREQADYLKQDLEALETPTGWRTCKERPWEHLPSLGSVGTAGMVWKFWVEGQRAKFPRALLVQRLGWRPAETKLLLIAFGDRNLCCCQSHSHQCTPPHCDTYFLTDSQTDHVRVYLWQPSNDPLTVTDSCSSHFSLELTFLKLLMCLRLA